MSALRRDEIAGLIPHAGAMCLLDTVEHWDATSITCGSARYAAVDNPLRRADGQLGAAGCIEIAAQAMALHGRLCAPADGTPRPGLLVSLRDTTLRAATLPAQAGTLRIVARQLAGSAQGASYAFEVTQGDVEWASGRAVVLFEAPR